jgi:hypothetical protein
MDRFDREERTIDRINRLSDERLRLYIEATSRTLSEAERRRIGDISRELADLWEMRRREKARQRDPLDAWIDSSYERAAA